MRIPIQQGFHRAGHALWVLTDEQNEVAVLQEDLTLLCQDSLVGGIANEIPLAAHPVGIQTVHGGLSISFLRQQHHADFKGGQALSNGHRAIGPLAV